MNPINWRKEGDEFADRHPRALEEIIAEVRAEVVTRPGATPECVDSIPPITYENKAMQRIRESIQEGFCNAFGMLEPPEREFAGMCRWDGGKWRVIRYMDGSCLAYVYGFTLGLNTRGLTPREGNDDG